MKLKHQRQKIVIFFLSFAVFLCAEGALLKLAHWQYNRMHEKIELQAEVLAKRDEVAHLPLNQDDIGRQIELKGHFLPEKTYLLEHQRHQTSIGMVSGWRVITPFVTDAGIFLVDRGWTPYLEGGERLSPDFSVYEAPLGEQVVSGVVAHVPMRKKGSLGGAVYATHSKVLLFFDKDYIMPEAEPFYIQSVVKTNEVIAAELPPLPSPAKHEEYMWTWLILALIFPCLYVTAVWQRRRVSLK